MIMPYRSPVNFSYAAPDDPWFKRVVIRTIERMTGQPYLKSLYDDHFTNPVPGESFWDSAVRRLQLNVVTNEDRLHQLPRTGPLVVVANHPFGVVDGIIICYLVARIRRDFVILTNSLLTQSEELKPYLLPIDFAETEEALAINLRSRAAAKHHLMSGGCLVVFPAGGVSTTPRPWNRTATDAEWKKYTGRLIQQCKAAVVPVYFAGQNSRLFQIASHISLTLRLSLLFKEVRDRIGSDIHVRIGEVIDFERLPSTDNRQSFMDHLRSITYALGSELQNSRRRRNQPGTFL
jgi:putative hemolysin